MLERMEQTRIAEWLEARLKETRMTKRDLSVRAGVAPSTVTRAFDPQARFLTSHSTIIKLADAMGVSPPASFADAVATGFEDTEAVVLDTDDGPPLKATQSRWQIRTRALELAGIQPYDRVIIDTVVPPEPGDIVCVQMLDRAGGAETIWRVYQHPYIVTATMDPAIQARPELVDGDRIAIHAPVVHLERDYR